MILIEGDGAVVSGLQPLLESEGYAIAHAADGLAGLNLVRNHQADLIIIAANLGGIDGITLCGSIRKQLRTPLLVLTSGADELQRIIAFERGADAVMDKPILPGELRARIRALLRRAARRATLPGQPITIGDLRIDMQVRRAWRGEAELRLTPKEFELLAYLMQHPGVALPRSQLVSAIWRGRVDLDSQTLDVHIRWLRQKVEPNPDQPIYIQTVRLIGYRMDQPPIAREQAAADA